MKIEQENINLIREKFAEMQSKEDLILLLSKGRDLLYGKKLKPFILKSLTYYANPDLCKVRYKEFVIKKKSGGERIINAPIKGLKSILRSLNFILQCINKPNKAATGFVLNKSIVDNAKLHVGNHYVYNLDLKDFFHSFDRNRVKMGFICEPFNLRDDREPLAFLLACLCTHPIEINGDMKTVLPQGSPTSPTITNILCNTLDRRLTGLADRFGAKYSRYADDITFSSQHNIYKAEVFLNELHRIIEIDQKLIINPQKTRLQKSGYRQEVTGLLVNEKVNVNQRYLKQLRMWIYYWEKYGFEKAQTIFKKYYKVDKGYLKNNIPNLKKTLDGKLEFLKMVKGDRDKTYLKLKNRFEFLIKIMESANEKNKNTKKHKPRDTVSFLNLFRKSEHLKFLTHAFEDTAPDYNKFIKACQTEYESNKKKYPNAAPKPLLRIKDFAFSKNPTWTTYQGKLNKTRCGWSEQKFVDWYNKNKKHPADHSKWNNAMIIPFKETIEVIEGNLPKIIDESIKEAMGVDYEKFKETIDIKHDNLKSVEFCTDVVLLKAALRHIFKSIKKFGTKKDLFEISIDFIDETATSDCEFKKLVITHLNSNTLKHSNDKDFIKGDLFTIKDCLTGLCNYEIEANFKDGKKKRIILTDDLEVHENNILQDKSIEINNEAEVKGFTHILKFY